jgi:hypothetical protein
VGVISADIYGVKDAGDLQLATREQRITRPYKEIRLMCLLFFILLTPKDIVHDGYGKSKKP